MPLRVVSLLPSATESLCLIGGAHLLVGRSHECDFPASITPLPTLTSQSTTADASPADIDSQVRAQLHSGASLYTLDADLLRHLAPDLILTQDLCAVCSIDLEAVRAVARSLPTPPRILSLSPETVEGVLDSIDEIGAAVGLEANAQTAIVALRERLFRAQDYVNPFADGPNVAFLEWTDPLFVGGHWIPQLIERAGGRHPLNPTVPRENAGAAAGPQMAERIAGKSITVSPDILAATRPDRLIISPCGVPLPAAARMARDLLSQPWAQSLPAVRTGHVAIVDGNQMFSRPGPRLIDAFEFLVGWLNDRPELIPDGFPWSMNPER
jgi:iron complex transport system substrate-binding protein